MQQLATPSTHCQMALHTPTHHAPCASARKPHAARTHSAQLDATKLHHVETPRCYAKACHANVHACLNARPHAHTRSAFFSGPRSAKQTLMASHSSFHQTPEMLRRVACRSLPDGWKVPACSMHVDTSMMKVNPDMMERLPPPCSGHLHLAAHSYLPSSLSLYIYIRIDPHTPNTPTTVSIELAWLYHACHAMPTRCRGARARRDTPQPADYTAHASTLCTAWCVVGGKHAIAFIMCAVHGH